MRISSGQTYSTGLLGIERNQSQLARLQNQISSNRRMLTPADDPVAAAKALTVSQSQEVVAQYAKNQGDASDRLGLVDGQLSSLADLLQSVRNRLVQAGNTTLADSDRQAIAADLEVRLDEMLGIANSRGADGDYLFSGYQGGTMPFSRSAAGAPATSPTVSYSGDDGQRLLQVGASQQMAISVAGSELFMNIRQGNGTFSTGVSGANQGSGVIDDGSVLDQQKWQTAFNTGFPWQGANNRQLQIEFSSPGGVSSYRLFDASTTPATAVGPVQTFAPGQAIRLQPPMAPVDFGVQVVITGSPASGDTFTLAPSTSKSVFQTLQEMVGLLRSPLASGTARTAFSAQLQEHLGNLDQALVNVSRVQTTVGARLQELDALSSNSAALDVQYQQTLSELQDLDYAKAISDFTRQQVSLEAAQKSFVAISGLSLFKYI